MTNKDFARHLKKQCPSIWADALNGNEEDLRFLIDYAYIMGIKQECV